MHQAAAGLIHFSDHGSQILCCGPLGQTAQNGIRISMSGKDDRDDNATVETFFKTLKSELGLRTRLQTRQNAEQAVAHDMDGFYNPLRRRYAVDNQSPVQFENRAVK